MWLLSKRRMYLQHGRQGFKQRVAGVLVSRVLQSVLQSSSTRELGNRRMYLQGTTKGSDVSNKHMFQFAYVPMFQCQSWLLEFLKVVMSKA